MPTTKRLLTDETGQALVTAINNIVAAVKPNATEIQMSSSDTTTVATAITNINDKIGTVPSGQTVEGQITTLNSNKANIANLSYGSYTYTSQAAMETGLVNLATTLGTFKTTAIYLYPNYGSSMFAGAPGVATIETGASTSYFSILFHNYGGAFYGQYLNGTWKWESLAFNSKLTLENANVSSNTKVIKGGTAGAEVPSLSASYAKYGNLVHFSYLFWGGSIDGANSQQLILSLPLPASQRTIRYYGNVGYCNAEIPDLYTVISANNETGAGQIAFVHHTSTGAEEAVTGEQISGKTVQGDIWYFTE